MEAQVTLGERIVPYRWRQSTRRRTLSITLHPETGITVHSPRNYTRGGVEDFLRQKTRWILRHLTQMEARRGSMSPVRWENGQQLFVEGRRQALDIRTGARLAGVMPREDRLVVWLRGAVPASELSDRTRAAVLEWYRGQARRVLEFRVAHFSELLGKRPVIVRVKEQKRRWGSCSAKGALNFNWKLILAPPPILDYVVVHELCHLIELNHSPRFWSQVERVMPDYREKKNWLRRNGVILDL